MKKAFLVSLGLVLLLMGCSSTDHAQQATLMSDTKSAKHYRSPATPTPNATDERIRLLRAQTDAKARLAEIEFRKAERLKKLETQRATTLARLKAEENKQIKALEVEQTKNTNTAQTKIAQTQSQTDILLAKERQANAIIRQQKQIAFYQQLLIAVVLVLLLLMLLLYLLYRHRQSLKLKLHEDELHHQAYLEASRQHHEKVTKMLEIIADASTDKGLKKELTKLLKENGNASRPLLSS